jgi:hypothetical protein
MNLREAEDKDQHRASVNMSRDIRFAKRDEQLLASEGFLSMEAVTYRSGAIHGIQTRLGVQPGDVMCIQISRRVKMARQ